MSPEKARELVAKELPHYTVAEGGTAPLRDAAAPKPVIEVISPSLKALKQRYFSDNAPMVPRVVPDAPDSGIVVVKPAAGKKGSPQAVIFSKGKIIGRQG
ncbi:hypothetical protein OKA05_28635 [Luteolibacter arcticus]|uniref:Uncharacterized protein n=1 Tax=Luteolibacter arcticus TaxID=1581411 RepID=A0ABT3GSV0_9BACT|nr:hypothetical protein [Luteolibacter arcticus]MCW1926553.1 hypothetical protein [Luteolibacter arcticus]